MKTYYCLIFLFFPLAFFAQKTVTGTITDATDFPLPGASIVIKGTTKGEVTNIDGKFTIELIETPAILIISYLGYIPQEIEVKNQSTVNVVLEEDHQKLDEIVLIGYGEVQRGDLTGSVSTVKPKENAVAQSRSVEDLLQGRAAGVS